MCKGTGIAGQKESGFMDMEKRSLYPGSFFMMFFMSYIMTILCDNIIYTFCIFNKKI